MYNMKPAILIVFLSSLFTGHYLIHAQTHFLQPEGSVILFNGPSTQEFEQQAHASYKGLNPIPELGPEVIKNYDEAHASIRKELVSECNELDSNVTVRIQLDKKGRYQNHHIVEDDVEETSGIRRIMENLSFKKTLLKGVQLLDVKFSFGSAR